MEYEHFSVMAFERQPNKWRARIRRSDGMPIVIKGLKKLGEFVTGIDCETAQAALMMAIAAIDAGTFRRSRDQDERRSGARTLEPPPSDLNRVCLECRNIKRDYKVFEAESD